MGPSRRAFIRSAALGAALPLVGITRAFAAGEAAQINADSLAALNLLYRIDQRAASIGPRAVGVAVFPKIVKGGFIFGAEGGKGELRIGGRPIHYLTIGAASFGLTAGVEWFSYALFFMNRGALRYLDQSDGWAVGSDPNVAIITAGAGASVTSTTLAKQVIAFPFGENGLMGDLSLQGSKITRYHPDS